MSCHTTPCLSSIPHHAFPAYHTVPRVARFDPCLLAGVAVRASPVVGLYLWVEPNIGPISQLLATVVVGFHLLAWESFFNSGFFWVQFIKLLWEAHIGIPSNSLLQLCASQLSPCGGLVKIFWDKFLNFGKHLWAHLSNNFKEQI